ncbi:MAG: helicase-related protein, partial [Flammeovirgaceae bacterium]
FKENREDFKGRRTFIAVTRKNIVEPLREALEAIGIQTLVSVDDSVEERLTKIQQATSTDESALIGTVDAFGESIDGMQHFDDVVLLTLPWNQGVLEQFMGRFKRLGGRSCRFRIVLAENTIDTEILEILSDKYADYVDIFDEKAAGDLLNKMQFTKPAEETLQDVLALIGG